jgi:hypothetical protein
MYRRLHLVYFAQPRRVDELLRLLPLFNDFNLEAAVSSAYYLMEDEELRAEYLFRRHPREQRISLIERTQSYFEYLDGRLFDYLLGGLFLHKEGLQGH